jgi:hypothetical protein
MKPPQPEQPPNGLRSEPRSRGGHDPFSQADLRARPPSLLVIAHLSIVYAVMFLIYVCSLYNVLRGGTDRPRILGSLVLVGGVLFVAPHAVSDIGITGLLGAKRIV